MQILRYLPVLGLVCASALGQNCVGYGLTNSSANNLNLGDDAVVTIPLGFSFPFNGATYNNITVSSNGFIWIGPNSGANQLSETESLMLSGTPRIAVCWDDFNPTAGSGAVYAYGNSSRISVSWYNVERFGNSAVLANCECVIDSNGIITLYYDASSTMNANTSQMIVGLSQGAPGAVSSQVDLSAAPAIVAATGYEIFPAGTFDLVGTTLTFVPTSPTDYQTVIGALPPCQFASATTYGSGCPQNGGAFYELFPPQTFDLSNTSWRFLPAGASSYLLVPGNGWDSSFTAADIIGPLADDDQVNVSLASIGSFPFKGMALTSVDLCSNGFLWMTPNASNDYSPTEEEFCNLDPRVAPCWVDLSPTLSGTTYGNIYWTTTPTFCMGTWENLPVYSLPATQNTLQVKLFATGEIEFNYLTVMNNGTLAAEAITGLSGGFAPVTGSIDFGMSTGANAILQKALAHSASAPPVLGGTYTIDVTEIPSGTMFGAIVLGLTQLNFNLSPIGITGCFQYVSADAINFYVLGGSTTMTQNIGIPMSSVFLGANLYSQGASFSTGFNPLGVLTSNGLQGTLGM